MMAAQKKLPKPWLGASRFIWDGFKVVTKPPKAKTYRVLYRDDQLRESGKFADEGKGSEEPGYRAPSESPAATAAAKVMEAQFAEFQERPENKGKEIAGSINRTTGEVIYISDKPYVDEANPRSGGVDTAEFASKELEAGDENVLNYHTHPDDNAFSDGDWKVIAQSQIGEMRVVTENHVYGLAKTPAFAASDWKTRYPNKLKERWNQLADELWDKTYAETEHLPGTSGMVAELTRRINRQMADEHGLVFTARPRTRGAQARSLYREDQLREGGRFVDEGKGSTEPGYRSRESSTTPLQTEPERGAAPKTRRITAEEIDERHRELSTARARLKALPIKDVFISEKLRTGPRTALVVADVLEEMHAKGYTLPDDVMVTHVLDPKVSGRITHITPNPLYADFADPIDVVSTDSPFHRILEIKIPEALPEDADLDDAVTVAFGGKVPTRDADRLKPGDKKMRVGALNDKGDPLFEAYERFAPRRMRDIVVHEMGHVQAGFRGGRQIYGTNEMKTGTGQITEKAQAMRRAIVRVSEYATKDEDEFMAESFTRLYRGETLSEDSLALYRQLNGPKIR